MTDPLALARLLSWLSPVFPTGGFAYSSGLEAATRDGRVGDSTSLGEWLADILRLGALRNDAIFFAAAHRDWRDLEEVNELALAMAGSALRFDETTMQAQAFLTAAEEWKTDFAVVASGEMTLPVAVGARCGAQGIDLESSLIAYLHSVITNQIQIAIRLCVFGQSGAAKLLAELEPAITETARFAANSSLNDLGGFGINGEVMAMKHEELDGRMFRS